MERLGCKRFPLYDLEVLNKRYRSESFTMTLLTKMMETMILALFGTMFVGYAIFLYPIEKLQEKTSTEVKQKQLKYAPH